MVEALAISMEHAQSANVLATVSIERLNLNRLPAVQCLFPLFTYAKLLPYSSP